MEWLNYHHLFYFWNVAREGGITPAGRQLKLSQPAISAQLRTLEAAVGQKLFHKAGRGLRLTEAGQLAYRYAEEIFSLGREMQSALRGQSGGRPLRFLIGIVDVLPKSIAYELIRPALALKEPIQIVCREDKAEPLLSELSVNALDLVLSDASLPASYRIKAFNHRLGECGVSFFAKPDLARRYRRNFPASLNGAPMLLPTENTALRRSLEQWFENQKITPHIMGEFEDSALMKVFGKMGLGVFAMASVIDQDICRQFQVKKIGEAPEIREEFYAISGERQLKHPAVLAISEAAKHQLFSRKPGA